MVSIREIAKKAGVAVSTVSRVLNDHPHVATDTRTKVKNIIDELGYVPNQVARDLSRGKTYKIGVVIRHTRHPYFIQLINGLLDSAQSSDYQLLFMPSNYQENLEKDYLEQLRRQAVDGLIFTSRAVPLSEIEAYRQYGPIVLTEPLSEASTLSSVYIDRTPAYLSLFQYLKDRNFYEIALLFSRNNKTSATYQEAIKACQAIYGDRTTVTFGNINNYHDGYEIGKILANNSKIQAVLATSDDVAAGVKQAYTDLKKNYPLLIGQENQLTSHFLEIITIDHKAYQLGQMLFQKALTDETEQIHYSSEVIWR